jgi:hypothetical protein
MLWDPAQYSGETAIAVTATQLDATVASAAQRRRIYADWIQFFRTAPTHISRLQLRSRVPQELLESLAGQRQLTSVQVKWGPYRDISVLADLPALTDIGLGGATSLESLEPLRDLSQITSLLVSEAHRVSDISPVSTLTNLEELSFGNAHPGSDRSVVLPDVAWLAPLTKLRRLELPGTRLLDPDLTPLLGLPNLESLGLPLRRQYRRQVFALAPRHPLFAELASQYTSLDEWVASRRS